MNSNSWLDQLLICPLTRCFRSKSSGVLVPRMLLSLLQAKATCKSKHSSDTRLCPGHLCQKCYLKLKLISSHIRWKRTGCIQRKTNTYAWSFLKTIPQLNFNNPLKYHHPNHVLHNNLIVSEFHKMKRVGINMPFLDLFY